MIKAENVFFSYNKKDVLEDISLELTQGKLYAVIGPNGCGKTTLINLLARLKYPKKGRILLNGTDYYAIKRKDFSKCVSLLPQGRNIPDMTVYDLVCCGRYPHLDITRKLTEDDRKIVYSALEATDTKIFADTPVRQLSGGQRQKVYIAMLLSQNTPYVLLDEPTTHLDISAKFEIMELLCRVRHQGKCVAAVLHDLDFALKYADEIILMNAGRIQARGTPEQLVQSGELQSVFSVNFESAYINGQTVYNFSGL